MEELDAYIDGRIKELNESILRYSKDGDIKSECSCAGRRQELMHLKEKFSIEGYKKSLEYFSHDVKRMIEMLEIIKAKYPELLNDTHRP